MKKLIFLCLAVALLLSACRTQEKIVYMQDVPMTDSTFVVGASNNLKIQQGDKLSIIVNTSIPEMANTFNLSVPYKYSGLANGNTATSQTSFYTVDDKGEIDFPILGKIKVEGLTRSEIAAEIKNRILQGELLKDAVVVVDYGNLTFSVLGEVQAPGRYAFDKDRITILEAISMAKDLTINGRRDNVLVTRTDKDGNAQTFRVDLRNAKALYGSQVYYVQQNDIIYIEPNKTKIRQSTSSGNTVLTPTFWISVASLLTTITALIIR